MTTPLQDMKSRGSRQYKYVGPEQYQILGKPKTLSNDDQQASALDSQDDPIRRRSNWAIAALWYLAKLPFKIAFFPFILTRRLFLHKRHDITVFLYGKHPKLTFFKILPSIVLLGSFGRRPLTTLKLATKKGPLDLFSSVPLEVSIAVVGAVVLSAIIDITIQSIAIFKERYYEPKTQRERMRIATFNKDETNDSTDDLEEEAYQQKIQRLEDIFDAQILKIKATIRRLQALDTSQIYVEQLLSSDQHELKSEKIDRNRLSHVLKNTKLSDEQYIDAVKAALTEPDKRRSFKAEHPWMQKSLDVSDHLKKAFIFPLRALGLMLTFGVGFGLGTWAAVAAVFVTAMLIVAIDSCCEHFKDQEEAYNAAHGKRRDITHQDNLFVKSLHTDLEDELAARSNPNSGRTTPMLSVESGRCSPVATSQTLLYKHYRDEDRTRAGEVEEVEFPHNISDHPNDETAPSAFAGALRDERGHDVRLASSTRTSPVRVPSPV